MSNQDKHEDRETGQDKKVDLTFVISGTEVKVKAKLEDALLEVVGAALKKGEHVGRPTPEWVLRNESGEVLDLNRTVGSYGLKDGDLLSLALQAGVAG